MKRYFIVFYISNCSDGRITGQTSFTSDGSYLNKETTIIQINKQNNVKLSQTIITNIIELNESDEKDWKETMDLVEKESKKQ